MYAYVELDALTIVEAEEVFGKHGSGRTRGNVFVFKGEDEEELSERLIHAKTWLTSNDHIGVFTFKTNAVVKKAYVHGVQGVVESVVVDGEEYLMMVKGKNLRLMKGLLLNTKEILAQEKQALAEARA